MKKILLPLLVAVLFSSSAVAQDMYLFNTLSSGRTEITTGAYEIAAYMRENLNTKEKDGAVKFTVSGTGTTASNVIPYEELGAVIGMLEYARDQFLPSNPETTKKLSITTSSDCAIDYVNDLYGLKKTWCVRVQTDRSDSRSVIRIKDLDDVISKLKQAQGHLQEWMNE